MVIRNKGGVDWGDGWEQGRVRRGTGKRGGRGNCRWGVKGMNKYKFIKERAQKENNNKSSDRSLTSVEQVGLSVTTLPNIPLVSPKAT